MRSRNRHHRRSSGSGVYAPVGPSSPHADAGGDGAWSPSSLYDANGPTTPTSATPMQTPGVSSRPPPSSFTFPFQAYPGNPDPGTNVPGSYSRRSSISSESLQNHFARPVAPFMADHPRSSSPASGSGSGSPSGSSPGAVAAPAGVASSASSIYRQSVGAAISSSTALPHQSPVHSFPPSPIVGNTNSGIYSTMDSLPRASYAGTDGFGAIPRNGSTHSFRAPFLSPASRPSSSLWSPPSYPQLPRLSGVGTPNASMTVLPPGSLAPPSKKVLPSTRLDRPLGKEDKPWLQKREARSTASWWITLLCLILGILGAAALCFFGVRDVRMLKPSQLCPVLDEQFNGGGATNGLDDNTWGWDVELGGFGAGQFHMTSKSSDNAFIRNNQLYIYPTLTSITGGVDKAKILDGGNFTLAGCTASAASVADSANKNRTAATSNCAVRSSAGLGTAINPVRSARINTKGKKSIRYGKVEVRAKLPRGDWLWPSVFMLPEDPQYGKGPPSGRIDILSSRGNAPSSGLPLGFTSATTQSTLTYGPFAATADAAGAGGNSANGATSYPSFSAQLVKNLFGYVGNKRNTLDQGFHTYGMEWTGDWMRFYVDGRNQKSLEVQLTGKGGKSLWDRGGFPQTAQNGSSAVVVNNLWAGRGPSAPFDQNFYLVVDLAAGGTTGWFPDNLGNKPWYDQSRSAMRDFATMVDSWYSTWPQSQEDRSFRLDSVKMWKLCGT
ncbi:hypothetical protein HGRIS_014639 [Hohenbuehelia grisea]